jgi:aryl-alcohol dehydrogenase-like predicted oxidoreductase
MGMSEFYGERDDAASLRLLHAAYELGIRHFDTADMYGSGHNEELLGQFLEQLGSRRDRVVVASKFGIRRAPGATTGLQIDSSPAYLRSACDASLKRLRTSFIDVYYVHRRSPEVPIEDTVGALADLVRAGKIRGVGLSEVSLATLQRASAEHPITALQSEYSLWSRDVEDGTLQACEALGVAFVAYSPLGRGFFGGVDVNALGPADLRHRMPRFQPGNLESNQRLLGCLHDVARLHGASTSQVALAWLLRRRPFVHPIPGSRKLEHVRANLAAADIALEPEQMQALSEAFARDAVQGQRYPEHLMRTVNV